MFDLPERTEAKVAALNHLRDSADANVNLQMVRWNISHFWLQGIRNLFPDYLTGTVEYRLYNGKDNNGRLKLLFEDVVVKTQEELGRLMRMDVRPSTAPRGYGLDRVRKASSGKVLLDHLTAAFDFDRIKESLTYHVVVYGTAGLAVWTRSVDQPGLSTGDEPEGEDTELRKAVPEVIPCWELYPIPFNPDAREDVRGILRKRWVPLNWLKKNKQLRLTTDEEKLGVRESAYGVKPTTNKSFGFQPLGEGRSTIGTPTDPNAPASTVKDHKYVLLEEYFFFEDDNQERLCRWVVKAGDHIALDRKYENGEVVYCPISIARYHPIGGFYGRSFVEILIPINSEVEQMAAAIFDTVKDLDAYGIMLFPNNFGVTKNELLKKDKTRKVCFYEPDVTMTIKDQVQVVNPANTGDFPGKAVAFGNAMIDRLTRMSDLMRGDAPGRVDSEKGMEFLHEMASIPLSVPANSIASAFAQVYKALLAAAPELVDTGGEIPLLGLDDSIIGLKVKPNSGVVELSAANFPHPSQLEIGIRDKLPSPPSVRLQKLMASLKAMLITPLDFKIYVWKENLDFPVGSWAEQEAFRKAELQALLLFGDGETPGQVVASTEADNPKITLMVLQKFMAKPEFTFAGPEVRRAFEEAKRLYQNMIGQRYPEGLMYPEEEAVLQSQMMGAPGAGPRPGGGPPQGGRPPGPPVNQRPQPGGQGGPPGGRVAGPPNR